MSRLPPLLIVTGGQGCSRMFPEVQKIENNLNVIKIIINCDTGKQWNIIHLLKGIKNILIDQHGWIKKANEINKKANKIISKYTTYGI